MVNVYNNEDANAVVESQHSSRVAICESWTLLMADVDRGSAIIIAFQCFHQPCAKSNGPAD